MAVSALINQDNRPAWLGELSQIRGVAKLARATRSSACFLLLSVPVDETGAIPIARIG
jgi:hypothetical protein